MNPSFFCYFIENLIIICLGDKKITEMLMKTSNKNYAKSLALDVILKHSSNPIQEHANIKILKLLLSYGADINHSLSDGTLPLHVALAIGK